MGVPESEAIPYEAQDLRGERLLVLSPHPDDEVIGCGGLIALHVQEGRTVRVIVATDGAQAGEAKIREEESRAALALLGGASVEFLRFPDRRLREHAAELKQRLRAALLEFLPDLIAVPNPAEIHPDHIALSCAFCELIQSDETLFARLAVTRVAFYEVSAPARPNCLVDISAVAESKYTAIAMHASQLVFRDYVAYARGLNTYRSMTLPPDVRFTEAYWTTPLPSLRTMPVSQIRAAAGAPVVEVEHEPLPVSVIVRTKDRPALLRDAIRSIRGTGYPSEVVIVNDGGAEPQLEEAKIINHPSSLGRSEAMNAGVRAARSAFIAFLDDDDLYYPEHLAALTGAAHTASHHAAWYTEAVSAFVRMGGSGKYETYARMRIFGQDFDRELLLVDNYIPLPTLLMRRDTFLDSGGFDPAFDLFEDWDFLIRLSQRATLAHVPRVTCEIRHIEGAGSITLESPEGSQRFREAKLQVWKKHASMIDETVMADVFERQKRRIGMLHSSLVESDGSQSQLRRDVDRLQREKSTLLGEMQALYERINEISMRISHLEGANEEVHKALAAAEEDRHEQSLRLQDTRAALAEKERTNGALFAETARLQSLLDLIYQSKTWKLHSIVEKMKGGA